MKWVFIICIRSTHRIIEIGWKITLKVGESYDINILRLNTVNVTVQLSAINNLDSVSIASTMLISFMISGFGKLSTHT